MRQIMQDAPAGYWPADDASGGLRDVIGGRNLNAVGTPTYRDSTLVPAGYAANLDATGDYFTRSIDDAAFDPGTADFSVGFAMRCSARSDDIPFAKSTESVGPGWFFLIGGGGLLHFFFRRAGGDTLISSGVNVADDKPHMVVAACDRDANGVLMVDGVATATVSLAAYAAENIATAYPLTIGRREAGGTGATDPKPYVGKIAHAFYTPAVLSADRGLAYWQALLRSGVVVG